MLLYFILSLCTYSHLKRKPTLEKIGDGMLKMNNTMIKKTKPKGEKKKSKSSDFIEHLKITDDPYFSESKSRSKRSNGKSVEPVSFPKKSYKEKPYKEKPYKEKPYKEKSYKKESDKSSSESSIPEELKKKLLDTDLSESSESDSKPKRAFKVETKKINHKNVIPIKFKMQSHDSNASEQPIKMAYKMDSHPKEIARMEKRKSLQSSDDEDSSEEDSDTNFYESRDKEGKVDFRAVYDKMINNYIKYVTEADNNSKNIMLLMELRMKVEIHIHQLHVEFHGADIYLKYGQWDKKMHKDFSQMLKKFTEFRNVLNMLIGEQQDESESNEEEDTSKEGYSSSQVKGVKILRKYSDNSSEEDSDTDFYSLKDKSGKVDFEAICDKMKENCPNYIEEAEANTGNLEILNKIYHKVDKHIKFISSELKGYAVYLGTNQMNEKLFNEFNELFKNFTELKNTLYEIMYETSESSESEVNSSNSDEEDSFEDIKELNSDINFDLLTDERGNLNYKKLIKKMKENYDNYIEEGDNNLKNSDVLFKLIDKIRNN
ncbi:hypothetical protein H311_01591, partial [Anncaliia algerae PRA109]